MQIKRDELNKVFKTFALNGNGVIVGAPGVGKTFLLRNLCSKLIDSDTKCLYLPVDRISVEKESEFAEELGIKTSFIKYLQKQKTKDKKGIIIVDGFDAARSEGIRNFYLNLIRNLINKLDDSWNILVSVRIYDAKKSGDLIDLFSTSDSSIPDSYQVKDIYCRHFFVPKLTKVEIEESLKNKPYILDIYKNGSSDLKNILKIPFNIWLLNKIVEINPKLPDLSYLTSEIQLLDLFWKYRVTDGLEGDDKEMLLSTISRKMIEKNILSIRKDKVYRNECKEAWNSLLSSEILMEITSTGQRVTFSHNILFDYAVSVLLIEDNSKNMIEFINEDLSRPLFLRPSLNYYFTRLWYFKSAIFWENFWSLFTNDNLNLHLFSRLLPIKTIVEESRTSDDFELLFNSPIDPLDLNRAISRIMQALISLGIKNDKFWVKFLKRSAVKLDSKFARELSILTSNILERTKETKDTEIIEQCGIIGRLLLAWAWENRTNDEPSSFYNFIGRQAIPLVAKTYATDIKESRGLLEKVLEILDEENFPIDLVFILTIELHNIWPADPEFAINVYKSVFRYKEISDSKVPMGTPVLPMSTTRRQDYEMCYYELIEHYPNFIKDNPKAALQAGIKALNSYIIETQIIRFYKDINLTEELKIFEFRGKKAKYISDGSYIWDNNYKDENLKIGDEIFKFILGLSSDDPLFNSLMDTFTDEACVAFFWKRLLEIGSEKPDIFSTELFELCIAVPIQIGLETTYSLGKFLKSASEKLEEEKLLKIEESILQIPDIKSDLDKEYLEDHRDRYLASIPSNLLKIETSKGIIKKIKGEGKILENRPLIEFGDIISEDYTEEKWFKDSGVDIEKPENQNLAKFFSKFDKFNSEFQNEIPNKDQIISLLPLAKEFYITLNENKNADEEVSNSAWTKLATYCEISNRRDNNLESEESKFFKKVLLSCANHPSPKPTEFNLKFDFPAWGPAPRNEAAIGLSLLAMQNADNEIINALKNLSKDKIPSVRYLVSRNLFRIHFTEPNSFWVLAEQIADCEENETVLKGYLGSFNRVIVGNEEKTVNIFKKLENRFPLDKESEILEPFAFFIIWLLFVVENKWAEDISIKVLNDPINKSVFLKDATFHALKYLNPKKYESYENNEPKKAVEWLKLVIIVVGEKIGEIQKLIDKSEEDDLHSKFNDLNEIINKIMIRIYSYADVDGKKKIHDSVRKKFYFKVKPLLEQIVLIQSQNGFMVSRTAYYFFKLLNCVVKYEPKVSLHMASEVAKAATSTGFNLDHLALKEVVKFVEVLLADHRKEIRNEESLGNLVSLLDIFADAGWSEAINLFWRLDEIFR